MLRQDKARLSAAAFEVLQNNHKNSLKLLKKVDNRYSLDVMVSKRARQRAAGQEAMTNVKEESPVTLAVNEIAEGKVVKC